MKLRRNRGCLVSLSILLLATLLATAQAAGDNIEPVPRADLDVTVANAAAFLRTRQHADGGFGAAQPQLTTAVVTLALLSLNNPPTDEDRHVIERAVANLMTGGTRQGDLGDREFKTESHALATLALLTALPQLQSEELRRETAAAVSQAVRLLQRWQDRSTASRERGGWKMGGAEGRENDRRASVWALLTLYTGHLYGLDIHQANLERGRHYLLGSYKDEVTDPDQLGGFSVDADGLAVSLLSSMGGWVLIRMADQPEAVTANRNWLNRHPPNWTGPNWFYENFFRLRTLHHPHTPDNDAERVLRRIYPIVRENQRPDGSIGFPPGNARNTIAIGPTFSTAFAILILNADNSRLVFDQLFRAKPPFDLGNASR